jgi:hypothetical protein
MLGVRDAHEHVRLDEPAQPFLEDVPRDAEATLKVVEAGDAEERVAEDEHAPPLAHDLEALCDGAVEAGKALAFHGSMVVGCIIERNLVESAPCLR